MMSGMWFSFESVKKSVLALAGSLLLVASAWGAPPPEALNLSLPPPAVEAPPGYKPPPSTLEKIREYGAIYVGHQGSSIPFSYYDTDGSTVHGFSWELCMRIVDVVRTQLGKPDLPVVPVLTLPSSRMMMIETGTIDLQCASVTNTEQRARYVTFSNSFFVAGVKALVRKDSDIKTLSDLRGKTVVTTSGTTSDAYVKAATARRNIFVNMRTGRSHAESFEQVISGAADAFVLDDILLQGLLASAKEADTFKVVIIDENMALEPYGLMMRKGDPEFRKLVNETLVGLMKSGEFERIYAKWFLSVIPPKGINLNFPMGPELKQLIKTPNDRGV
jgi:glutamate/aspartate transport system substrate-binding protein